MTTKRRMTVAMETRRTRLEPEYSFSFGSGVTVLSSSSILSSGSESKGIWTLQAGVFAANLGSIGLHERCGFRIVGRRERLGQLGGVWHDVLLLERRSDIVG